MVLKILLMVKIISQKMLNRKYFLYFHINDMNSIVASVYPYLYCSSLLATLPDSFERDEAKSSKFT